MFLWWTVSWLIQQGLSWWYLEQSEQRPTDWGIGLWAMKEDYIFYRMKTKRLYVQSLLASLEKLLDFLTKEIWKREKGLVSILGCYKTSPELWQLRSLMWLPVMVVELWGLQSKTQHRTGPVQSWMFRAVPSQILNLSNDGDFKASLELAPAYHYLSHITATKRAEKSTFLKSLP